MTPTTAETIALKAAAFLVAQPLTLKDFLNDSGAELASFRENLNEAGLQAEFLDFIMRDPVLFSRFQDREKVAAETVHAAWETLSHGQVDSP